MEYLIKRESRVIKGEVIVPASKSISNRLLIISELCNPKFIIRNLSESDDTSVLIDALKGNSNTVNIGHAGTAMRFLTAFFASQPGEKILTGSERMKDRPIGNLVESLKSLGADISYVAKKGFPPLKINGKILDGGRTSIDSSVSSQFISALLLAAPSFKNGLEVKLENKVISSSYINLTLKLMEDLGVKVEKSENIIKVKPQTYKPRPLRVEGDWSSASYWYEIAAFADEAEIFVHTVQKNSPQGDSHVADIFKQLGINTEFFKHGIQITKTRNLPTHFEYDFIENPDLVQTLAVTCVLLKIPFRFTGTQSLRIKETDRITALQNELSKFGATINYSLDGTFEWNGKLTKVNKKQINIYTYGDHRMALAFAPIAMLGKEITIQDPEVVTKSYPTFWNDLQKFGFSVTEIKS